MDASSRNARAWQAVVYALTFLTGASGLVYQVVWQRYLTRLLGSDSLAVATVLGVFLGGLSLGYLASGKLTLRVRSPFVAYGVAEAFIGLWGLAFPAWFAAVAAVTASWRFEPTVGLLAQGALCTIVLILPPTMAMGSTVPMLTRGLSRSVVDATAVHARVYSVNAAGAVVGALTAGFVLIYRFGLPGSLRLAAALNVAAAAFFLLSARRGSTGANAGESRAADEREAEAVARPRPAGWALTAVVFTSGVYFMTLENLVVRYVNLTIGTSSYGFALTVAVFVLCIAIGGGVVARRGRSSPAALFRNQAAIGVSLVAVFLTLDKWPYAAHVLRVAFSGSESAFVLWYATVFAVLFAVLVVPASLMGATLPLAFDVAKRGLHDVGERSGVLLAWNAAGNLFGGLVGGFAAFRWLGAGEVFLAATIAATASAVAATQWLSTRSRMAGVAVLVAVVAFASGFPAYDPLRFAVGTFRLRSPIDYSFDGPAAFYEGFYASRSVLAYRDAPEGTFAVVENPHPATVLAERFPDLVHSVVGDRLGELVRGPRPRSIVVNGKADSSTFFDRETLRLVAHVPALLGQRRDRVLLIGLGTGVSAGEFALYPDVETIDVAEISPTVVEFLPFFEASTHRVHHEPRLRVHVGDGFRILRRATERWDVIASEPSNPWMSGVDQMFSREFYALVKQHLAPDGVFLQWIQRYATNERIAGIAVNTLLSEFRHVTVFRTDGADDLLLAGSEPLDEEAYRRARTILERNPAVRASLAELGIRDVEGIRAREHPDALAIAERQRDAGIETLDRPRIHYLAGWAFFSGQSID